MQLTKLIIAITLLGSTAIANPLEARSDKKDCNWECDHYKPKCDYDYKPMYCDKWGKQDSCKDYCKYSSLVHIDDGSTPVGIRLIAISNTANYGR